MTSKPLGLSVGKVEVGEVLSLVRPAAQPHPESSLKIVEEMPVLTDGISFQLEGVIKTEGIGNGTTCKGDSGAPLLDEDGRLVAIHSAGVSANCDSNDKGKSSYHSRIDEVEPWLRDAVGTAS